MLIFKLVKLETKLDSSKYFSVPHRLDRSSKDNGILLYVRDEISFTIE